MATAWVGDDSSRGYWVHVDYDEPGPFSFLQGPGPVSAEQAVAWARAHAKRVIVREGERHYSAGEVPVRRFPRWPGSIPDPVPSSPAAARHPQPWRVEARTGWYRADGKSVARNLGRALEADARARHAIPAVRENGFSVSFTVVAASELDGHAVAYEVLRDAWAALGIEAEPGDDFDVSSITLRAA